jgi:hypothetical protein
VPIGVRVIDRVVSAVPIVGGCPFCFRCQRHVGVRPRAWGGALDESIPDVPAVVRVDSFLCDPAVPYLNLVVGSADRYTRVASSDLLLLARQVAFFMLLAVRTPPRWRAVNGRRSPRLADLDRALSAGGTRA